MTSLRRHAVMLGTLSFASVATLLAASSGGCGGEVTLGQDDSLTTGEIDAGTGRCGNAACASGQLCCAGSDSACTPTCMSVTRCPVLGRSCTVGDGGVSDGSVADGAVDAPTTLTWYSTCGDPVCRAPDPDAGPQPVCPKEGTPCTQQGETCGTGVNTCGSIMVCDDHDPKSSPGGCPISSAKYKEGIQYLGPEELARLHDETLATKLATYSYKAPFASTTPSSDAMHLGFIVEDQPHSLAVDRGHDRVDLYGYVSMVVATVKVQDQEIQDLKKELASVKSSCRAK
jgi:hypothetical protein